ncbi:MAG: hypothetical protein O7F73_19310 [Gammaproteobacteria bacterium]|nr:hypothetical protein [Gammaproteobacteria bacterium]
MSTSKYPLTHRVLVCTRMDMFRDLDSVNALSTHGPVLPRLEMDLETASQHQAERIIKFLFPVFLHNLIRAEDFPLRDKLRGALEQMEQNIRESAQNAMVQELLTCGLQGKICDAAGLPEDIDAKRAVALYLARQEWDTLYRTFYLRVSKTLIKERRQVAEWLRAQKELQLATA